MSLTFAQRDRRRQRIGHLCRAGTSQTEIFDELRRELAAVIPFEAAFLSSTDPATTLFSSTALIDNLPRSMCEPWLDNEFLHDDFNKFVDLHRSGHGPSSLHRATLGRPQRSRRFRDVHLPFGFGPELRATFDLDGACWGVINLLRAADDDDFSDDESEFLASVTTTVAEGLRRAVLLAPVVEVSASVTPGVVLLDPTGGVVSMTDKAAELLAEFGHRPVRTSSGIALPAEAYVIAARARARANGMDGPDPITRMRARSGHWLTLRGDCVRDGDGRISTTAIVIELAHTIEVVPLVVAAYGLSPREKSVLASVVRGRTTTQIAAELGISSHTVRDHIKSLFEKVGVSSRGQLVSRLYRLHYQPSHDIHRDD